MVAAPIPVEIFCCYASADEAWLHKLETHLSPLRRQGLISLWHHRLITPGTDWAKTIDSHLETASVILLLVSADFFASDYCYGIEMKRALERQEADETHIIPILVRPVDWKDAPFAHLQTLPTDTKPLSSWQDEDTALADVTDGIRRVIVEEPPHLTASAPRAALPTIWNIPYRHNPFFLGRESELAQVRQHLQASQTAALSQPQAISGLGGIGKTQLAIEYAYRYGHEYQAVLWVQADTTETLNGSYTKIFDMLHLSQKDAQEQKKRVQAVKDWLRTHQNWLLLLDNADELNIIQPFLPTRFTGHILITTRAQAMGAFARRLEINVLSQELGALLLLRRAGLLEQTASLQKALPDDLALAKAIAEDLGGLPLALDQAGSYIEETQCSLADYLHLYQTRRALLLKRRGGLAMDHPEPVATTWSLSFEKVEQKSALAADLLRICAFLPPDAIPIELFTMGAVHLGPHFACVAKDPLALDEAIAVLGAYSLIHRNAKEKTLSIHRLVQAVIKDTLDSTVQEDWTQRVILSASEAWETAVELLIHSPYDSEAREVAKQVLDSLFSQLGLSIHRVWGLSVEQVWKTASKVYGLDYDFFGRHLFSMLLKHTVLPPDLQFQVAVTLFELLDGANGSLGQYMARDVLEDLSGRKDISPDLRDQVSDYIHQQLKDGCWF